MEGLGEDFVPEWLYEADAPHLASLGPESYGNQGIWPSYAKELHGEIF